MSHPPRLRVTFDPELLGRASITQGENRLSACSATWR